MVAKSKKEMLLLADILSQEMDRQLHRELGVPNPIKTNDDRDEVDLALVEDSNPKVAFGIWVRRIAIDYNLLMKRDGQEVYDVLNDSLAKMPLLLTAESHILRAIAMWRLKIGR